MIVTTASPPISPSTNTAVATAQSAIDLATKAELNPVVKADLQTLFDSYSHNPVVGGVVTIAGVLLAQHNITIDNTLLTVAIGVVVTGVGYAWQWASMRMRKPTP